MDSGPYNVVCGHRSYFNKDLISWIYLTSKSMKIGVQQILMKPDYLFYSVVIVYLFIVLSFLPDKQIT